MRKMFFAAIMAACLALTGCSGVSQEEYDILQNKYNTLQAQNNTLNEQFSQLTEDYNSLSSVYSKLKQDTSRYMELSEAEKKAEMERLEEQEEERRKQEEAERLAEEALGYETGITFDDISRSPNEYKGKKVKFSGNVLQIIEGYVYGEGRLATDGTYDDVVYFDYDLDIIDFRLLEDDKITIYGTFGGLYTYETVMGGSVTLPKINVDIIEVIPDGVNVNSGEIVSESSIEDNILEYARQTKDGQLCVFVTNNNDFFLDIDVQAMYKDASGNIIDTYERGKDNVSAGATVIYVLDAPDTFESYDLSKSIDLYWTKYYNDYYKDCSISANEGEDCIIVELKNNSNQEISSAEYSVVFYDGDEILTAKTDTLYSITANKTEVAKIKTNRIADYDRFEVYLNYAYGSKD